MSNFFTFTKKYKYYILTAFMYIALFIQMHNVYLYSDDYDNLRFQNLDVYYNNWSGRLIAHAINVYSNMAFGTNFFKLLNPIFVLFLCILISKIANVNNKYNFSKILFFSTVLVLGINVLINREFLYYQSCTVPYLWGFVPMLLFLYILISNKEKGKNLTWMNFLICTICLFLVNYMMETSMILMSGTLFFMVIESIKNKKIDKKMLLLLIIAIFFMLTLFFIPGNINRINAEHISFENIISSNENIILYKIRNLFGLIFSGYDNIILFIILTSTLLNLNLYKKYRHKITYYVILFMNILLYFITYYYVNINPTLLIIIHSVYLISFLTILFRYLSSNNRYYFYMIISSIASALFAIIIVSYNANRFIFGFMISMLILNLYIYINSSKNIKFLTSMAFICLYLRLTNIYILLIILTFTLIYMCIEKSRNIIYICSAITVLILCTCSFILTIKGYMQNATIFEYNINEIKNIDYFEDTVYLKKLINEKYAYYMPENMPYCTLLYKHYYNIPELHNIVWY